ncbi:MAG: beta-N-acetylhexosaminidase [Desulfobulbaceae bacterium]|nr:beta-N-acetylhexosaminidase [Desulfobulbaceae bacterium]
MPKPSIPSGALLMIGLPGPELDDSCRELIASKGVSNFILFRRNVVEPPQLRKLCRDLDGACREHLDQPALIAIDQEGGSVTRLPPPWRQFPDQRLLAEAAEPTTALANYAATCAAELLATGINFNFAPVLDVAPASEGFFMTRRSLGSTAATVAQLGAQVIREMQRGGVATCGKHFPGLGSARLDPHQVGFAISKDLAQLTAEDLPPFQAAIATGVAALMTSHTVYPGLDQMHPATLSSRILTGLLREELGYDGLVVTDDLEMGAIENAMSVAEAALLAFKAGADLLLICKEHDKVRETIAGLDQARANGTVQASRVTQAAARIDRVRRDYPLPER